jgi:hypothetical protein
MHQPSTTSAVTYYLSYQITGSPLIPLGVIGNTSSNSIILEEYIGSGSAALTLPVLGNVARVDQVYGNDSLGSIGGYPFQTINSAVNAVTNAVNGGVGPTGSSIWVMPGTYNLSTGIVLATGSALRGMNTQTVAINMLNVTGPTTLVTMGPSTRLEDVTLNVSTSTGGFPITGIRFPGNTSITAKLRTAVVNATSTAPYSGNGGNVYGILSDGSTTTSSNLLSSSISIRATTINVSSSATGTIRGIMVTGPCQFSIRDTIVFATGPTGPNGTSTIGAESSNTGSFMLLKTSSIFGSSSDIKQVGYSGYTGSTIQLAATDLLSASSGSNGFTVNTEPNQMYFNIFDAGAGTIIDGSTNYLLPGTVTTTQLVNNPLNIPFSQKVIIFALLLYLGGATGGSVTINLFNYNSITSTSTLITTTGPIATGVPNQVVRLENFSSTFFPFTSFLRVQIVISGGTVNVNNSSIFINISTY